MTDEGHYTELVQKNIDTGMGLERLAVVCQDVDSLFDVDTVMNITNKVTEITGAQLWSEPREGRIPPCDHRPYPLRYVYDLRRRAALQRRQRLCAPPSTPSCRPSWKAPGRQ